MAKKSHARQQAPKVTRTDNPTASKAGCVPMKCPDCLCHWVHQYTIDDLQNIAIQLGWRIRFDIIPIEMIAPRSDVPKLGRG